MVIVVAAYMVLAVAVDMLLVGGYQMVGLEHTGMVDFVEHPVAVAVVGMVNMEEAVDYYNPQHQGLP